MEEKITINSKIGLIEINNNQVINFLEAPLGYSNKKNYVLVEDKNNESIFLWLQSIEDINLSFPVLEVELLGYKKQDFISMEVVDKLEINDKSNLSVYTIVTIPSDPIKMTANFKGPIIINNNTKKGLQTILNNNSLEVAKPIFVELQSRILNMPKTGSNKNDNIKPENKEISV